jgi:hypothetical protein
MSNYQTEVYAYGMYDKEPVLSHGYVLISSHAIPIYYFDYNGWAILEGDIVVSTTRQMLDFCTYIKTECGGDPLKVEPTNPACISIKRPWAGGIIPFMYDSSITKEEKEVIVSAINIVNGNEQLNSVVRFVQRVDERDFVSFTRGAGYSASVGMAGGKQLITIPGDVGPGSVLHELVHTIGLLHEQTKPNRDGFVKIVPVRIAPGLKAIFTIVHDPQELLHPQLYDTGSVMNCSQFAYGKEAVPPLQAGELPGGAGAAETVESLDGGVAPQPAATAESGETAGAAEPVEAPEMAAAQAPQVTDSAYMSTVIPNVPNEDMGQRYEISETDVTRIAQLYTSAGANSEVA